MFWEAQNYLNCGNLDWKLRTSAATVSPSVICTTITFLPGQSTHLSSLEVYHHTTSLRLPLLWSCTSLWGPINALAKNTSRSWQLSLICPGGDCGKKGPTTPFKWKWLALFKEPEPKFMVPPPPRFQDYAPSPPRNQDSYTGSALAHGNEGTDARDDATLWLMETQLNGESKWMKLFY